jgi:hypothetical protein
MAKQEEPMTLQTTLLLLTCETQVPSDAHLATELSLKMKAPLVRPTETSGSVGAQEILPGEPADTYWLFRETLGSGVQ